jgi:hypothetical protein
LKSIQKSKIDFGSEMKFESRDFDFNEFPNSERSEPFLNRKILEFGRRIQIQINDFKPKIFLNSQGKDLNFKRRFSPNDLDSIYFIESKGRFRIEIESNFEWTWVDWTWEYFLNNSRLSFKVLKIKPMQG